MPREQLEARVGTENGVDGRIVPLDPVTGPTTLRLELAVDEPLVPAAVGIEDDTRVLGLAVRTISVE